MVTEYIVSVLSLIGFGTLLGTLLKGTLDFFIATKKAKQDSKNSLKETRYKAIILLCYTLVYYDREKTNLVVNRPDITSMERLQNELHAEFINMALYGADGVINKMKLFMLSPTSETLNDLAIEFRKDLYGIKTKLQKGTFDI